jgi:hypothetical protein
MDADEKDDGILFCEKCRREIKKGQSAFECKACLRIYCTDCSENFDRCEYCKDKICESCNMIKKSVQKKLCVDCFDMMI